MSLLMDALKRAEEAKRQNAPAPGAMPRTPPTVPSLELELEPEPQTSLPELSDHLSTVEADLRASADDVTQPRPRANMTSAAVGEDQAAARNMFEAKPPAAPEKPNVARLVAIIGVGCVAGLGIGGYFYYQYQAITGMGSGLAAKPGARSLSAPSPIAAAPKPAVPPPAAPPSPSAPAPGIPTSSAAPPSPSSTTASTTPTGTPATPPPRTAASEPATGTAAGEPSAKSAVAKAVAKEAPARRPASTAAAPAPVAPREPPVAGETPLRVTTGTQKINADLATAYQLLQSGSLQGARDAYERALRGDPRNLDALNGLAAIAVREGQNERAQALYAQALDADPKNPTAMAGLIGLRGQSDPGQAESRLKSILAGLPADSPQAGSIQFSLGNLYAGQRRWNEAQMAYFQAYASDGANPDYLYNLAVSLDHLQQNKLAAQFYQSALSAAEGRAAGFDRARIQARLIELQR